MNMLTSRLLCVYVCAVARSLFWTYIAKSEPERKLCEKYSLVSALFGDKVCALEWRHKRLGPLAAESMIDMCIIGILCINKSSLRGRLACSASCHYICYLKSTPAAEFPAVGLDLQTPLLIWLMETAYFRSDCGYKKENELKQCSSHTWTSLFVEVALKKVALINGVVGIRLC